MAWKPTGGRVSADVLQKILGKLPELTKGFEIPHNHIEFNFRSPEDDEPYVAVLLFRECSSGEFDSLLNYEYFAKFGQLDQLHIDDSPSFLPIGMERDNWEVDDPNYVYTKPGKLVALFWFNEKGNLWKAYTCDPFANPDKWLFPKDLKQHQIPGFTY